MAKEQRFAVTTPRGDVTAAWVEAGGPVLVVGHGAGVGMDHPFLTGFSEAAAEEEIATIRFNFPYLEAGRRSPDSAANAIAAYRAVFDEAVRRAGGRSVLAGGKSYGGRIASMAAAEGMGAHALVFLGYPLHPPGKPGQVRDEHLYGLTQPMLFLQGTKDPFATPEVLAQVVQRLGQRAVLVPFEGAGHSFERSRKDDPRACGAALAPHVAAFVRDHP
ncbi:MAG: alpha/beta family hydrolase [Planctomycetaceae bacterium]